MKALIIDNEDLFRLGIRHLLDVLHDFDEIIEITTERELLALPVAKTQEVSLTVLNPACFPDMLDAFWRPAQQVCPSSKIIAMVGENIEPFVRHGIQFVQRGISAHELAILIKDILNENRSIESTRQERHEVSYTSQNVSPEVIKGFSKRRLQILGMAAHGLSNKDIAFELNIAEGTVKAHMHLIMKMLNVTNRTQAAIWYQTHTE
jgi:DNA-binding NarL/FixJ family response regulator